jgi:hypothetical protein
MGATWPVLVMDMQVPLTVPAQVKLTGLPLVMGPATGGQLTTPAARLPPEA